MTSSHPSSSSCLPPPTWQRGSDEITPRRHAAPLTEQIILKGPRSGSQASNKTLCIYTQHAATGEKYFFIILFLLFLPFLNGTTWAIIIRMSVGGKEDPVEYLILYLLPLLHCLLICNVKLYRTLIDEYQPRCAHRDADCRIKSAFKALIVLVEGMAEWFSIQLQVYATHACIVWEIITILHHRNIK